MSPVSIRVLTIICVCISRITSLPMIGNIVRGSVKIHMSASTTPQSEVKLNPRDERRRILKNDNYNRMGFKEEKAAVEDMMTEEFASSLIKELRDNKGKLQRGDLTILLAEYYGFCWGVERSVMSHEFHLS